MIIKNFYSKFRIALLTFAFGLASFWFFDGLKNGVVETQVNLPKAKSENFLVVFPRYKKEMPNGGEGGGGGGCGREYED